MKAIDEWSRAHELNFNINDRVERETDDRINEREKLHKNERCAVVHIHVICLADVFFFD